MEEKKNNNQLEQLVTSVLSIDARARISNIRLANPIRYNEVLQQITALYQQGYFQPPLQDAQLVQLLKQLNSKKEITIRRR